MLSIVQLMTSGFGRCVSDSVGNMSCCKHSVVFKRSSHAQRTPVLYHRAPPSPH